MRVTGADGDEAPCHHVEMVGRSHPRSPACAECVTAGGSWVGLLICLTCGWVACSDESAHHHARAHYEETDHAVAATFEPSGWRWCYVHQRVV